jgi:hypothetical protein
MCFSFATIQFDLIAWFFRTPPKRSVHNKETASPQDTTVFGTSPYVSKFGTQPHGRLDPNLPKAP